VFILFFKGIQFQSQFKKLSFCWCLSFEYRSSHR